MISGLKHTLKNSKKDIMSSKDRKRMKMIWGVKAPRIEEKKEVVTDSDPCDDCTCWVLKITR